MRLFFLLTFLIISFSFNAFADINEIEKAMTASTGLGANDLSDLAWDGSALWITGPGTLSKRLGGDGYKSTDWITYSGLSGFGSGSPSAIYASGGIMMLAWVFSEERNGSIVNVGDGLSISVDSGVTWKHIPILTLFPERDISSIKYPGNWTVTYDIASSKGIFWCSTTAGFLLKSSDGGTTWSKILPNTDVFDFSNPNHHGQCVDAYGDTLWVGTFQGMNLSTNAGRTWTNISWTTSDTLATTQKPGNFCVAVEHKVVAGKTHVWVGSMPYTYTGLGKYGICHSDNNGATWDFKSTKYNAWNFAFGSNSAADPAISDSTVFAASDSGLAVSLDLGDTWEIVDIKESDNRSWNHGQRVLGVAVVSDTLWVTSTDGIAYSIFSPTTDWRTNWHVLRGVTRVRSLDTGSFNVGVASQYDNVRTYAFPNPFTPKRLDADYSRTRVQYALTNDADISISIYDYSGKLIKKLIENQFRSGGKDYQEIWDGRDADGDIVPNGVYFYLIKTNKGDSTRGKIVVLD